MKWLVGKCNTCGHNQVMRISLIRSETTNLTDFCKCPSRMGMSKFDAVYTKAIEAGEGVLAIWNEQ